MAPESPSSAPSAALDAAHAVVERYYSRKVQTYGATPLGVDWSCVPTQEMRFVQLLKVCDFSAPFSLNDLGCGYGALLAYLARRHRGKQIDYLGTDLSAAMVAQAVQLWRRKRTARFEQGHTASRQADYGVASGIFNVKLEIPTDQWERFIAHTLRGLSGASRKGFAVNFLAPLCAGEQAVPELYRTPPDPWVRFCAHALGAQTEVLANYGMREFTLLVRTA